MRPLPVAGSDWWASRLICFVLISWLLLGGQQTSTAQTVFVWGQNLSNGPILPSELLTNIVDIAAGGDYNNLAIRSDGSVVSWGVNGLEAIPVDVTNVIAVAAGESHRLALREDGRVIAWGANYYGQTNVPSDLTNAIAIAAGSYHNLALLPHGKVVAWGSEFMTSTPSPDGPANVPLDLPLVTAIAAGGAHSLALTSEGRVIAWGSSPYGQANVPPGLSNVVAIAAGSAISLALRSDGTVKAWGFDFHGATEVPAGLSNVVAIAAGGVHSLALRSDGTVVAWGSNTYGESEVPLGLTNVIALSAGDYHSMVLGFRRPIFLTQPVGRTLFSGLPCTFSATALASAPVTYQWRLNGTNLPFATNADLTLASAQMSDAGEYTLAASNFVGLVISEPASLVIIENPPLIPQQPSSQQFTLGASVSFQVGAIGSIPFQYQWRLNGTDIQGATQPSLVLSNATSAELGSYSVVVMNSFGSITSNPAWLYRSANYQFQAPSGPLIWYPTTLDPTTRSDMHTIWISSEHFQNVGWSCSTTWSLNFGTRMFDGLETCSSGTEDFYYFGFGFYSGGFHGSTSQNGAGSVAAPAWLDGHWRIDLQIMPKGGQFSGLASVVLDNDRVITIPLVGTSFPRAHKLLLVAQDAFGLSGNNLVMSVSESDLSLESMRGTILKQSISFSGARLSVSPAKGTYNGLFSELNADRQASSGSLTLTVTAGGAFSGKLLLDGGGYAFQGRFDLNGSAQIQVARGHKSPLTLALQIDSDGSEVYGTATDGNWLAKLSADHVISDPATNYVGVYTLVIPGHPDLGNGALGEGYATIAVDFRGAIRMNGELADGTRFNQTSRISNNGEWPLYVPLYGGRGLLTGWIGFTNFPATSLGGELVRLKPNQRGAKYYASGLTNQTSAFGSSFTGPIQSHGQRWLNFSNAVLVLEGGNLTDSMTNVVSGHNSTVSSNTVAALKWNTISGLVRGSFTHPVTGKDTLLQGVLVQNQNRACGYFLGTNQSGSFRLVEKNDPELRIHLQ